MEPVVKEQMFQANVPTGGRTRFGEPRVIWSLDSLSSCELVSGRKENSDLFNAVLQVRCATDTRWPDQNTPVDDYSDQYCMFVDGDPVGSLGVTRALEGPLYLGEFAPRVLLDYFGDVLVSAYRFRILSSFRRSSRRTPGVSLSLRMVREAWRDQIAKGAMLDLIQIETSYAALYERMGYIRCEGYEYTDPLLGTPSSVMFLPTDPDRESVIQDIVRESGVSLSFNKVLRVLSRKQVAINSSSL